MKKFLVRLFIRHIFKWVGEEDLFERVPGGIKHKGKLLPSERVDELSQKAESFRKSYFWRILSDEVRYTAYLHWLKQGEDISARMLLRAVEIIDKKLEELSKVERKLK